MRGLAPNHQSLVENSATQHIKVSAHPLTSGPQSIQLALSWVLKTWLWDFHPNAMGVQQSILKRLVRAVQLAQKQIYSVYNDIEQKRQYTLGLN